MLALVRRPLGICQARCTFCNAELTFPAKTRSRGVGAGIRPSHCAPPGARKPASCHRCDGEGRFPRREGRDHRRSEGLDDDRWRRCSHRRRRRGCADRSRTGTGATGSFSATRGDAGAAVAGVPGGSSRATQVAISQVRSYSERHANRFVDLGGTATGSGGPSNCASARSAAAAPGSSRSTNALSALAPSPLRSLRVRRRPRPVGRPVPRVGGSATLTRTADNLDAGTDPIRSPPAPCP